MPTHQKKPVIIDRKFGYIGETPSSKGIAYPAGKSFQYLNNWAQNGQIFSYSGPPDYTMNADIEVDGNFYVILHSPELTDGTTQTERRLGGYLHPWRYNSPITGEFYTYDGDVRVSWTPPGDSEVDILNIKGEYRPWTGTTTKGYSTRLDTGQAYGFELAGSNFYYTPDAASRFYYGVLSTEGICPAALSIWTLPLADINTTNEQIQLKNFGPGQSIRAYTGDDRQSVGDLIHRLGEADWDEDYIHNNARRCIFQWGHPVGVWSDVSATYTELFEDARYRVTSQNVTGSSSGTVSTYPAVVVTCSNASAGNEGYVKIESGTGGDSWILPIDSDAVAIYDYTDASSDTLDIDSDDTDLIKVSVKAPPSGEITLHTVSLWEDPWF